MSAALVVLVLRVGLSSATAIVCGWQPMPDGSPSYECIVQVEPRLLDSLNRGDSIPLSVDIPEHVRPISRIRLVVGSDPIPKQLLAQAPKKSLEGVVQTQFTTSNNGAVRQYNNPSSGTPVIPASDYVSDAQNAFARSLRDGSQAVRNAVSETAQDILPPDPGRGMTGAMEQAGRELGNNLRNASETVREDIRQLFGAESTGNNNSEILPPEGNQPQRFANQTPRQIMPADSASPNNRRLDQPINSNQPGDWQSRGMGDSAQSRNDGRTGVDTSSSQVANSNAPLSPAPTFSDTSILPRSGTAPNSTSGNRYEDYSPPHGAPALANRRDSEPTSDQAASSGLSFPPFESPARDQSVTPTPQPQSSVGEIRRDMLDRPATADIQGANGLPIGQQPINQATASPTATDFNWNSQSQQAQTRQVPSQQLATQQPVTTQTASPPVFPLLLSWVLLSGSGAGNLYLFWSYVDVRNKYQDLVGDAPRRISRRRRIRD